MAHVVVSENVFIAIEDGLHTVLSAKLMEQHFEGFVVILDAIYKVSVDECRPDYDQQRRKVNILSHMMKYLTQWLFFSHDWVRFPDCALPCQANRKACHKEHMSFQFMNDWMMSMV